MTLVTEDYKGVLESVRKSSEPDTKMSKDSLLEYVSSFANSEFINRRKTMKTSYNRELDQRVYEWFVSETRKGEILSGPDICNKALEINNILGGSSDFKASTGWLKNFKYRHGISLGGGNCLTFQVDGHNSVERMAESSSDNIQNSLIPSHDGIIRTPPYKKRKHVMLSLKDKLDIITRLRKGEVATNLAREYNIGKSTVNDIKMKQDALLNYVSSFPNCDNMHRRKTMKSAFNKDLDKAVYRWYTECLKNGLPVSGPAICDKALDLNKEFGGDPEFKASSGWLQNFKIRHGLHFSVSGNGKDNFSDFNPQDLYPDIYLEEGNANSSECDSINSNQNVCLPNCDAILNVPDENNISYKDTDESNISYKDTSENDISYNDTHENEVSFHDESAQVSVKNELVHAFKTVIDWTKRQKECSSSDVINLLKLHKLACMKGMPVACSLDDSELISSKIERTVDEKRDESISIEEMYEIDRSVKWIKDNRFSKIALQFPESMLSDAVAVSLNLEEMTERQTFILSDMSHESCCVDEVSAEHISADAVIHYGHSCLSPIKQFPVLYVFGKQVIDIQDTADAFQNIFPDKKSLVILLYEVFYSYVIDSLAEKLKEYDNLIISRLEIPGEDTKIFRASEVNEKTLFTKLHRHLLIPSELSLNNYKLFYVGSRPATLTNFMLTFKNSLFYSYNPLQKLAQVETLDVNRHLRRRYCYITKAKDANIIGILVGTVGVSEHMSIITHLKELIKQAGKKSYTFVVGKLNSAKLANFAEVEIFVNVACVESTLTETRDFNQPIITPFELEIALNQAQQQTGNYTANFPKLFPGVTNYLLSMQNTEVKCEIDDESTS
ncbi:2-(3-amino-3-carboxypropyl)histidine synthase subunit 2 [Araneus ventricosus]|uniref:2-(3-amino-3-carboxypropyl)histidine synthase subunit 2 n=1 Tax=Araneus ventricosus TaxID=182803 RepID=A0A4Y2HY98_ARAVE|nr:2-(3-amino-3-carboxypropyl)histidine synthase subunit 2 [Araneus ventricosus]